MLSRRAFVEAGAALAALAASRARAAEHANQRAPDGQLRVIIDRSFDEGLAFGAAAERRGAHVDAVDADLGSFWMRTLEPRLRHGPFALAGLTAGAPLFCLELLCRDYGLTTVYRIEHARRPDGGVRHTLTGDPALDGWTERLAAAGAQWAAGAAELATSGAAVPRPTIALEPLDLRAHEHSAQSLFTWMIAPPPVGATLVGAALAATRP
ncbi:MAG TPA: hypothetical protein VIC71_01910 [Gammaproteobacteria bacterium]|jgi:hypothetical protein